MQEEHLIEEKIIDIFYNCIGISIQKYTESDLKKSMIQSPINLQARDLLKLYMELEKEFKIDMSELVMCHRFDYYYDILSFTMSKA